MPDSHAAKLAAEQETGVQNPTGPQREPQTPGLTPEQAKLAARVIRGDDPFQGEGQSGAHDALLSRLDEIANG